MQFKDCFFKSLAYVIWMKKLAAINVLTKPKNNQSNFLALFIIFFSNRSGSICRSSLININQKWIRLSHFNLEVFFSSFFWWKMFWTQRMAYMIAKMHIFITIYLKREKERVQKEKNLDKKLQKQKVNWLLYLKLNFSFSFIL